MTSDTLNRDDIECAPDMIQGKGPPVEIVPTNAYVAVVRVTPELARYWLTLNRMNRPISPRQVMEYARDIGDDAWDLNYQTITFREDGSLNDGQHRLEAVLAAGRPILSLVVWGVPRDAFRSTDIGMKRSAHQIVNLAGRAADEQAGLAATKPRAYGPHLSAAAALIWKIENDVNLSGGSARATVHDRLRVIDSHPRLIESIEFTMRRCNALMKFSGSTAVAEAVHYYGTRTHGADVTNRFYHILNTGLSPDKGRTLTAGHPAYTLREHLMRVKREGQRPRMNSAYSRWVTAWNAYVEGTVLRKMVYSEVAKPSELPIR